jgi:polysaccharide export outer membrane protein
MNKIFFLAVVLSLGSCTLAPNRMFKTPPDYAFARDTSAQALGPYYIQPKDRIEMRIFSNNGFKLVDVTSSNITSSAGTEGINYVVQENGEVKLPVIGPVVIKGMSIKDAEDFLQNKYSVYYKDPFVVVRVVSRQALVFQGDDGKGTVIHLENDNTTLFEALAMSGGLSEFSKASQIKIVRGDLKNPQIFYADVSTLEGLRNSQLQIYPNDIIYIDAGSKFRKRLTSEFLPYFSIITSILVFFTYLNK